MAITNLLCLLSFFLTTDKTIENNNNSVMEVLQTINAMLIRVFTCICTAISALYIQELYPTPVRSLGVGM